MHKFLQCLGEYKFNYVQQSLEAVFQKDLILQTMMGLRGGNKKKLLPKELTSDLEIHCSLSYGMNQPPHTQTLLSILIIVDAYNVLRCYLQYPDQSELLFKHQLRFRHAADFATTVEFYLRAKAIIVSSKRGQNIVITSQLKQYDVFGTMGNNLKVSKLLHFDHKSGNEMIALGLYNGDVIVKQAETLLSDDTITTLRSANVPDGDEAEE